MPDDRKNSAASDSQDAPPSPLGRVPGHYWVQRVGSSGPPLPGRWTDGYYWLIDGQAARDDEVIVHGDRLDPPDTGAGTHATSEWIKEPVTTALAGLHAALDETQTAVRLHLATDGIGGVKLSDWMARREITARSAEALAAVLRAD